MGSIAAVRGVLAALLLLLLAPVASAADQETYYLGTDGFPRASLVGNPLGGEIPNFDKGRDVEPGLLLERSTLGLAETDDARYQHWQMEAGGVHLVGYPVVVIWAAPAGFDAGVGGEYSVYLLDCNSMGSDCTSLESADATIEAGTGDDWVESWLGFDLVDHRFGPMRYLGVRVVVAGSSESDLMLAYGYPKQRSRLTIYAEPPLLPQLEVAAPPIARPASNEFKEKLHRIPDLTVTAGQDEARVAEPAWAWVITLVISTGLLIALGAFLLAGLTRPGRHERKVVTLDRHEHRVPVSTR